jgi:hypothetical protein
MRSEAVNRNDGLSLRCLHARRGPPPARGTACIQTAGDGNVKSSAPYRRVAVWTSPARALNGFRSVRTPGQGAAIAIQLATLPDDGPTGGFFDDAGAVPW